MTRRGLTISAVVLLALTAPFTIPAMLGSIDEWQHRPTTDFRENAWKSPNLKYRYAVLDHVAAKIVTVGMDQREVVTRLGKPDFVTPEKNWQYETRRPGHHFIDFSGGGVFLTFDQHGRIAGISKNLWVD